MSNLTNKVVVLVGTADALGQAVCRRLHSLDCRVGVLTSAGQTLTPFVPGMVVHTAEANERAAIHAGLQALSQALGPIDVLLHRAPVYEPTAGTRPASDSLRDMLQANCLGGIYAVEAVLPAMLARREGRIVELSSLAALRGTPGTAAYAATARAFATYLESLRPALMRRGVQVTTVFAGFVPSDPMTPGLNPEAAASWVVRLIQRGRREGYYPWRFALAARLLRRLPARIYDAWAPRLERFLSGASFR
jgi:NADP-dependent 3-hydroxy acid dehydrogenase YdfG